MNYLFQIKNTHNITTIYQGPGITPSRDTAADALTQNFAAAILHGSHFQIQLLQKHIVKAILLQPNPLLLDQFRNQLQKELEHLFTYTPKNENDFIMWNAFLGNLLAILPFTYPSEGKLINIPIYKDGKCDLVEYKIEVMHLQEPEDYTPLTALGLTPTQDPSAPPILAILGTTYPAGNGFFASVLTDFRPKHSVGEYTYKHAKPIFEKWFHDKQNVRIVGVSLGGAIAFHILQDFHAKLQQIDVYNPPSLYDHCWKIEFNEGCLINIYQQPHDIVSWVGSWPHGKQVHLYYVTTKQKPVHHNLLTAHIRAYTGCSSIIIQKLNPKDENLRLLRKIITFFHFYLGPLFVYYPLRLLYALYKVFLIWKKKIRYP